MELKISNLKIYLGITYLAILLIAVYFLLSNFNISELTSYEFIKENKDIILKYKDKNIFLLVIIFFFITVLLNLLMCPMLLPTLIIGFIFGKWLGTSVLVLGNTLGGLLLYLLAQTFFSKLIKEKFSKKFSKFISFFNKNEIIYFMCFRFIGGGGAPFPIQNILPVLFNMSSKNYVIATLFGIIPTTFVTAALGSGIEKIIDQNVELNFFSAFLSPEIYLPIVGFFTLLLIALLLKNRIFK